MQHWCQKWNSEGFFFLERKKVSHKRAFSEKKIFFFNLSFEFSKFYRKIIWTMSIIVRKKKEISKKKKQWKKQKSKDEYMNESWKTTWEIRWIIIFFYCYINSNFKIIEQ